MLELKLKQFGNVPITSSNLQSLLAGYKRPNDKISEWIKSQTLIPIRRGLYVVGDNWRDKPLSLPLIANRLYGPSCVSLDYALAWYGLIPERVVEITSVTAKRSRIFDTTVGRFSYTTVPLKSFAIGLTSIQQDGINFLMASPEKALCDKLLTARNLKINKASDLLTFLEQDLRLDIEMLSDFDTRIITAYENFGVKSHSFDYLTQLCQSN